MGYKRFGGNYSLRLQDGNAKDCSTVSHYYKLLNNVYMKCTGIRDIAIYVLVLHFY